MKIKKYKPHVRVRKHGNQSQTVKVKDVLWKDDTGKQYSCTIALRFGAMFSEPIVTIHSISEGVKINIEDFHGIRGNGILKRVPVEELKQGGVYHEWRQILPESKRGQNLTEVK